MAIGDPLAQRRTPRSSRLGGHVWFGLMVGGWGSFALLLFSGQTLGELRDAVRDLSLVLEALVWPALFPFVLALTVRDTAWETPLRLLLVGACAIAWSLAFYPWCRGAS